MVREYGVCVRACVFERERAEWKHEKNVADQGWVESGRTESMREKKDTQYRYGMCSMKRTRRIALSAT